MVITCPFLLELNTRALKDPHDAKVCIEQSVQHERRVKSWLKGDLSSEELEDSIRDLGHNPYEYWDVIDLNLDRVIANNTPVEGVTLLLPDYLVDGG